jgi:hypothetical protein
MEGSSMRKSRNKAFRRILIPGFVILLTIMCMIAIPVSRFRVLAGENTNTNIQYTTYVVHTGDTLWGIADAYMNDAFDSHESYINEVMRCNRLESSTIYNGQLILIPCDIGVSATLTASELTSAAE